MKREVITTFTSKIYNNKKEKDCQKKIECWGKSLNPRGLSSQKFMLPFISTLLLFFHLSFAHDIYTCTYGI